MVKDEIFNEDGGIDPLINYLNSLIRKENLVYRGYSIKEQLIPSIIREITYYGQVSSSFAVERIAEKVEFELLERFERYGSLYNNIADCIDLISNAQHYGLPTRLLDFTYKGVLKNDFNYAII